MISGLIEIAESPDAEDFNTPTQSRKDAKPQSEYFWRKSISLNAVPVAVVHARAIRPTPLRFCALVTLC